MPYTQDEMDALLAKAREKERAKGISGAEQGDEMDALLAKAREKERAMGIGGATKQPQYSWPSWLQPEDKETAALVKKGQLRDALQSGDEELAQEIYSSMVVDEVNNTIGQWSKDHVKEAAQSIYKPREINRPAEDINQRRDYVEKVEEATFGRYAKDKFAKVKDVRVKEKVEEDDRLRGFTVRKHAKDIVDSYIKENPDKEEYRGLYELYVADEIQRGIVVEQTKEERLWELKQKTDEIYKRSGWFSSLVPDWRNRTLSLITLMPWFTNEDLVGEDFAEVLNNEELDFLTGIPWLIDEATGRYQARSLSKEIDASLDPSFSKGFYAEIDHSEVPSFGLVGLASELDKLSIVMKVKDGEELSAREKDILELMQIEQEVMALDYELNGEEWNAASLGRSVGFSTEIISQIILGMAVTGGVGTVTSLGAQGGKVFVQQGVKQGTKAAVKKVAKEAVEEGIKQVTKKEAAVILAKNAGVLAGRSAIATAASPMTWHNFLDRRVGQYSFDENGEIVYAEQSWASDLFKAYTESFFEYYSEMLGAEVGALINLSPARLGRIVGLGKWGKAGEKSMDFLADISRSYSVRTALNKVGMQGLTGEVLSEVCGDVLTNLVLMPFYDEYNMQFLSDPHYWGDIVMTSGILGAAHTTIGAATGMSNLGEVRKAIKARDLAFANISDAALADELKRISTLETTLEISEALANLNLNDKTKYSDAERATAMEYITNDLIVKASYGAILENSRLERFYKLTRDTNNLAYEDSGRILTIKTKDGKMYYVKNGDIDDANSMLNCVDAKGKKVAILASEVQSSRETTIGQALTSVYDTFYKRENIGERLMEVESTLRQMKEPTREKVQAYLEENGLTIFKEGDMVTLADGTQGSVESVLDNGDYVVKITDPEGEVALIQVPALQVLQPNAEVAKAQKIMFKQKSEKVLGDVSRAIENEQKAEATPQAEGTTADDAKALEEDEKVLMSTFPVTEDGSPDFDSITNPKQYALLFAKEMGGKEAAHAQMQQMKTNAVEEAEKLREKGKKLSKANDVVKNNKAIAELEQRISFYDEVLNNLQVKQDVVEENVADNVEEAKEAMDKAEAIAKEPRHAYKVGDVVDHNGRNAKVIEVHDGGVLVIDYSMGASVVGDTEVVGSDEVTPSTATIPVNVLEDNVEEQSEGLVMNGLAKRLTPRFKKIVDALARLLKVKVVFVETLGDANGYISGTTIYLSYAKRDKGVGFLTGHEVTHRLQEVAPKAYAKFKEAAKKYRGKEWDKEVNKITATYEEVNRRRTRKAQAVNDALKAVDEAIANGEEDVQAVKENLAKLEIGEDKEVALAAYRARMHVEDIERELGGSATLQDIKTKLEAEQASPEPLLMYTKDSIEDEVTADVAGEMSEKHFAIDKFLRGIDDSRLKRIMRDIWQFIKDLFADLGADTEAKRARECVEKLNALIAEGVKSEVTQKRKSKSGARPSLVGVHNISLDKLRKSIKMGGLANPSVAVIDVDKQTHDDYGDYSLVLPKNMVDSRQGKNAGTWAGDAWTPTYPQVIKRMNDDKAISRFYKDIDALPEAMRSRVRLDFDSFMDGRSANALAYWYLVEKGNAPEMVLVPSRYSNDVTNAVSEATKGSFSMFNLTPEERAKCLDAYIAVKFDGDRAAFEAEMQARIERLAETIETKKSDRVKKWAQDTIDSIKEYGFDYDDVATFIRDVEYDAREKGKVNVDATILAAQERINESNLAAEYDAWRNNLDERYGIEEYIFDGYTNSGNRRYLPHTVENASKWMKKQGREGAVATFPSFGTFVAVSIPKMTTLESIRKRKALLGKSKEEYDAFREKWENVYYELGKKLQPDAKSFEDYGYWRLIEAVGQKNPKEFIKKQYGIELSEEDMAKFNDMVNAIRTEYPARYFETKFERPLQLSDFTAAVVPNDIPLDVESRLKDAGVEVIEYEKGDNASRAEAMQKASEMENVRFSIIGEVGASALDMAEEATIRMDNLAVAREMETSGKDAKAIRMATGWERGADGLWRYEIMDAEVNLYDGNEAAIRKQIEVAEEKEKDFMQQSKADTKELRERTNSYLAEMREKYGVAEGEETDAMTEEEIAQLQSLTNKEIEFEDYKERRRNELYNRRMALEAQLAYVSVKNSEAPAMILTSRLGHVLKGEYAEQLFKAYPSLKDMEFRFVTDIQQRAFAAYAKDGGKAYIELNVKKTPENMVAPYLMHEVQHAIQDVEGFAEGGSPAFLNKKLSDRLNAVTKELEKLRAEGKTEEADALVKLNKGLAEAVINNDTDDYGNYQKLMGEVEARNVSSRINMSAEERLNTLLSETEDVAREDQIFLRDSLGVAEMGSRVTKRMAEIKTQLLGKTLTSEQEKVVNVYAGLSNNEIIEVQREDGVHRIVIRQGREDKVGTKHSVLRHYDTGVGYITAEDILRIPEIIALGKKEQGKRGKVSTAEYSITDPEGVKYTVVTEYVDGREVFDNYYTNRKASLDTRKTHSEEARDSSNDAYSEDKDTTSSAKIQTNEQKFSLITPEMDAAYLDAMERGDMQTAQQMVMEAAEKAGYINDESWRMNHRAPRKDEENANPFNTEKIVPEDFWEHPEWYTNIRHSSETRESYYAIKSAIDKYKRLMAEGKTDEAENVTITMYRGVDKTANKREASFRNGDWITPSRSYALSSAPYGKARVISQEVKLKDIWWDGNSINEWGYDDGANYGYRDTKNNRKLLDPVTYDDNGNVIPLSERFNPRKEDIRYSLIGEIGAANIEDYGRYGSPMFNLEMARELEAMGKSAKKIRLATNWERGADGKWRYEIMDGTYNHPTDDDIEGKTYALKDILDNDYLFEAYPDLAEMTVVYDPNMDGWGAYNGESIALKPSLTNEEIATTLLHEVQHAIQHREMFARGGNKRMMEERIAKEVEKLQQEFNALGEEFQNTSNIHLLRKGYLLYQGLRRLAKQGELEGSEYEAYRRLAGEVEARNVQKRMGMGEDERLNTMLEATEDVARKDQEIIFREAGVDANAQEVTRYSISAPSYTDRMVDISDVMTVAEHKAAMLENAKRMASEGVDAQKIVDETGWIELEDGWHYYGDADIVLSDAKSNMLRVQRWLESKRAVKRAQVRKLYAPLIKEQEALISDLEKGRAVKGRTSANYANAVEAILDERDEALAEIDAEHRATMEDFEVDPEKYMREYEDAQAWNESIDVYTQSLANARNEIKRLEREAEKAGLTQREKDAAIAALKSQVRSLLSDGVNLYMRKREIQAIMNAVNEAQTTYAMARAVEKAMWSIYEARMRMELTRLNNLLRLKLDPTLNNIDVSLFMRNAIEGGRLTMGQAKKLMEEYFKGVNGKGISVARYIDGDTATIMGFIAAYSDLNGMATTEGFNIDALCEELREALMGENIDHKYVTKEKQKAYSALDASVRDRMLGAVPIIRGLLEAQQLINGLQQSSEVYAVTTEIEDVKREIDTLNAEIAEIENEGKVVMQGKVYKDKQKLLKDKKKQLRDLNKKVVTARIADAELYLGAMPNIVESLDQLNGTLETLVREGRIRLSEFHQKREERRRDLVNMAIEDIDRPAALGQSKIKYNAWQKIRAAKPVGWALGVLESLDHLLRVAARNAPDGEGQMWNHFSKAINGAYNRIFDAQKACYDELSAKTKSLFGIEYDRTMRKAERTTIGTYSIPHRIERVENGERVYENNTEEVDLTISQALDIISMWNQPNGKETLMRQGFTEEKIEVIKGALNKRNPKWLELQQWVVNEFLPAKRVKYNNVHREMNGVDMDYEVNYFPMRRDTQFMPTPVDITSPDFVNAPNSSVSTGAIIKRQNSLRPFDLEASFFMVLKEHLVEMERWSEMAPVTRDLNLLLSSPTVKKALESVGEGFYQKFVDAAKLATGNFQEQSGAFDELFWQVALRRWASARLALKAYTALKQMASSILFLQYAKSPSFIGRLLWYCSGGNIPLADRIYQHIAQGAHWDIKSNKDSHTNITWALENSAMFRKRWASGTAGYDLFSQDMVYGNGKTRLARFVNDALKLVDKTSSLMLRAIAIVDAFTSAAGMRAVYEEEMVDLMKQGLSKSEAHDIALFRAEIAVNKTQQSSENLYLSPVQKSKGFVARSLTTFMNAPIAQGRNIAEAIRELGRNRETERREVYKQERKRWKEYYHPWYEAQEETIKKEKEQGIIETAEQEEMRRRQLYKEVDKHVDKMAEKAVGTRIKRAKTRALLTLFLNAWIGPAVFNLMSIAPYMLMGDDDEEKEKMMNAFWLQTALGPLQVLPLGPQIVSAFTGYKFDVSSPLTAFSTDINNIVREVQEQGFSVDAAMLVGDFILEHGMGVDVDTLMGMYAGIESLFEDGYSREAVLMMMGAPNSQVKLLARERKEGETAQEYYTRLMRLYSILEEPKYEDYFTEDDEHLGDTPFGMKEYQMRDMRSNWEYAYRLDVVNRNGKEGEYSDIVNTTDLYKENAKLLPSVEKAFNKEGEFRENTKIGDHMLNKEEYIALAKLRKKANKRESDTEHFLGQDEQEYLKWLRKEVEAKRAFNDKLSEITNK